MSQKNVEIVRSFYASLDGFFDAYRKDPQSLASAFQAGTLFPEATEMLSYEHPQLEWTPWSESFVGTIRGHFELLKAWDDWLEETEDYGVTLEEAISVGDDLVLAVVTLDFTAKSAQLRVKARVFTLYTLHDGMIVRVDEYPDRHKALAAAGLSEQDAHADS